MVGLIADFGAAALIVAIIYSPAWDWLTALSPTLSEPKIPYYHWDAFAMGAAVGFRDGGALGTDVFSQYGVGWPMLFTALDPVLPLSYTNMVGLSVSYCCLYFVGIYVLLRLTLGGASWALAGTVLAVGTQLFRGMNDGATIWTFPSSTMMRSPFDVWFFLALLMHMRTSRVAWAVLASALAGLELLFEIDTGVYLTVALLLYASLRAGGPSPHGTAGHRHVVTTVLACGVSFLATLLTGLAVASRGTILSADFWRGCVEGLVKYGGGMFALPLATAPRNRQVLYFYASVSLFLVLFARALIPPRDADRRNRDLFWGVWSHYGLAYLILFVYRSHSFNIYHAAIPILAASVYVAAEAAKWADRAIPRLARQSRWLSLSAVAGYATLAVSLVALIKSPAFRNYPGLVGTALLGSGVADRPSESARTGPTPIPREVPIEFASVVAEMASLRSRGNTVGVIHPSETMFYLHSRCPRPFRYYALVMTSLTIDQLNRNLDRFARANLDYVLIAEAKEFENAYYYSILRAFRAVLESEYALQETIGSFELWRRRGSGSHSTSAG